MTDDLLKRPDEGEGPAGGVYGEELRVAVGLAREAGAAALGFYGKPLHVEHKDEFD